MNFKITKFVFLIIIDDLKTNRTVRFRINDYL